MNRIFRAVAPLAAFAAFGLLAACGQGGGSARPPLEGAKLGGPFTLVNQDGKRVSDTDFAGKYRLIYFGYTFCPDICPVDMQKLMAGYALLQKSDPNLAEAIQPIFITVDPERDTPDVLRQWVSAFNPRLIGLTGTPQEIAAVAKEYSVYYAKQQTPGASGYLMDHSRAAYLFGPKGEPIALISQDADPQTIAGELRRWAH